MTSPSRTPAVAAGLSGSTDVTSTPDDTASWWCRVEHAGNRHGLAGHADVAAADASVANQLGGHEPDRVAGDREAQPLGRDDRGGVDADDITARGHERAARSCPGSAPRRSG